MDTFQRISVQKAHEIIESTDVTIVDVRDANAFLEGHMDKACHLNDQTIDAFLKEKDKNKPLICYCYHGFSSQNAAQYFVQEGFKVVYSIDGGFTEWSKTYA